MDIKVTDIQIGDWFRHRYTIDNREITRTFRVSRIEDELKKYYVWGDGFGRMCYPEKLEPIPITAEILEKNGFKHYHPENKKAEYWQLYVNGGDINVKNSFGFYRFRIYGEPIKIDMSLPLFNGHLQYIHELQHCLKLVGIDKEITI